MVVGDWNARAQPRELGRDHETWTQADNVFRRLQEHYKWVTNLQTNKGKNLCRMCCYVVIVLGVAKYYGCKHARRFGLNANGCSQVNRDFSCEEYELLLRSLHLLHSNYSTLFLFPSLMLQDGTTRVVQSVSKVMTHLTVVGEFSSIPNLG